MDREAWRAAVHGGRKDSDMTKWLNWIELNWEAREGFPGGWNDKESAYNAGEPVLIPGLRRSPGGGHGNPHQYSCLENSMDEEPDRLQSLGLQRVGHDWATNTHAHTEEREFKGGKNRNWYFVDMLSLSTYQTFKRDFIMILVCVFLMANNLKCFFMCSLPIQIFSFKMFLLKIFAYFNWVIYFC